jgi:hypothetical protein
MMSDRTFYAYPTNDAAAGCHAGAGAGAPAAGSSNW